MTRRFLPAAGTVLLASAVLVQAAAQDLTRAEALSLEKKLAAILERGNRAPAQGAQPLRTPMTEREINAYLKFSGQMPAGLVEPRLTIADANRVDARALIDLDAIRKSKPRGTFDPLGYVSGSVEAIVSGNLYASNGKGVFQLRSATVGGVSVPRTLLQEIITFYSRTPDHPNGWDMDSPFDLPHNIRQVEVRRGAATIVQ
jgi:hypothetical protein